jgi:hypothetical protein
LKPKALAGTAHSGHEKLRTQTDARSNVPKHIDITNNRDAATAFISKNVDADQVDDDDTGQALENMNDLLKDNVSDGAALKDDDSVVHESEALESTIENTEDNLKSDATRQEATAKEQLKQDLKDYASVDSSTDKAISEGDISSSNNDDDTTEALTLPESGDSLPSESEPTNIVHTRTAIVLPRSVSASNAPRAKPTPEQSDEQTSHLQMTSAKAENAVDSSGQKVEVKKHTGTKSSNSQDDAFHKFASSIPNLDDLARAIPNVDKDALQMYNSVDDSDLGNDDSSNGDSLDIPASFVQVMQEQAVTIPQADLDMVWNSLKAIADQSHAGLNMIDLLRHGAPAQPMTHASLGHHSQHDALAVFQEQGTEQQCTWLLQNFEQRQENRRKVNAILKRAKAILGRTRIPARRLRGLH